MELMTAQEVAEYLGGTVKAATLRWWKHENKGKGPRCFQLGRKIVYRKSDVDAWLEAQYAAGDQASA